MLDPKVQRLVDCKTDDEFKAVVNEMGVDLDAPDKIVTVNHEIVFRAIQYRAEQANIEADFRLIDLKKEANMSAEVIKRLMECKSVTDVEELSQELNNSFGGPFKVNLVHIDGSNEGIWAVAANQATRDLVDNDGSEGDTAIAFLQNHPLGWSARKWMSPIRITTNGKRRPSAYLNKQADLDRCTIHLQDLAQLIDGAPNEKKGD